MVAPSLNRRRLRQLTPYFEAEDVEAIAAGRQPDRSQRCAGDLVILDNFGHDSSALTAAHRTSVREVARRVAAGTSQPDPIHTICLTGHTDTSGAIDYNQRLGQRRAEAVKVELVAALNRERRGLSAQVEIRTASEGELRIIAPETDAAGRARNRRVEVMLNNRWLPGPPQLDIFARIFPAGEPVTKAPLAPGAPRQQSVRIGSSQELAAVGGPLGGGTPAFTWSVSPPDIVSVEAVNSQSAPNRARVTGLKAGQAVVTMSYKDSRGRTAVDSIEVLVPSRRPEVANNTDPTHWFLSDAEIEATRGRGELKRKLRVFTSENLVQPLIDGEEYMTALSKDLAATKSGDFVHFTAWRMDRKIQMLPTRPAAPGGPSSVEVTWKAMIGRGVTSRTMLWHAPLVVVPNRTNNDATHDMLVKAGGQSVRDARFPIFGSHHQKSAILQVDGEAIAYCGGIDLCADRWDTRLHNNDPKRVKDQMDGWHDVHARIRGPAALDVELNFRDRWNDTKFPTLIPPIKPPTPITSPLPSAAKAPGTHHVQMLRTYACASKQYPTFAPAGERSGMAAYLKAFGRAQRYIYIEDQYLYFDEIATALVAALKRIEALIIVVPHHSDATPIERASQNFHQAQFIATLRRAAPSKVHVFDLIQPSTGAMIYVHAKTMIIDDIYAVIGTTNVGRRSMTYDTEISAAVVDADMVDGVCRFARDLRRNLWGEHLAMPATDPRIADPITAVAEWESQAKTGTNRVRSHTTAMPQSEDKRRWDAGVDPDGRC